MKELLELALKSAEQVEVYHAAVEETSVGFESNRLKNLNSRQGTAIALRLIKNGRIGFAISNRADNSEELVNMAVEVSEFGATAAFDLPGPATYLEIPVLDKAVGKVPLQQMVGIGEDIIAKVVANTPGLIVEGRVGRSVSTVTLTNSRGGHATCTKSVMSAMMEGTLLNGTDMLFVGEDDVSCHPLVDGNAIAAMMIEQLENSRQTGSVRSGSYPVIFTPTAVAGGLLGALAQAFNGRTVLQGASPIGHKMGQQVFDKRFNLWDDGTIPFRPASRAFDDEGVPCQKTSLVEEGVVSHFLYDLQTAGLAGARSTGNGSRAGGLPAPAMNAIVIGEGSISYGDLVRDIKEGLVVEMLMGAGQGNTLGGDFSGNVLLGYKVKDGKLAGRVKDTMVSGNIYEALKDVVLGKDARWVGGMLRTPSILFPHLAVSSNK